MGKTLLHYILGGCEPKEKKKFDAVFSADTARDRLAEVVRKYAEKDKKLRNLPIFKKLGLELTTEPLGMNSEEYQKLIHEMDMKGTDKEFHKKLDRQYYDKASVEVARIYKEYKYFFDKANDVSFDMATGYLSFKGKEFILLELLKRIGLPADFYQESEIAGVRTSTLVVDNDKIGEHQIPDLNKKLKKFLNDQENPGVDRLHLTNQDYKTKLTIVYDPSSPEFKNTLLDALTVYLEYDNDAARAAVQNLSKV